MIWAHQEEDRAIHDGCGGEVVRLADLQQGLRSYTCIKCGETSPNLSMQAHASGFLPRLVMRRDA